MDIALITGAAGLIGSAASEYFTTKGFQVAGVDNDLRKYFFGEEASTKANRSRLERECSGYHHHDLDIRDAKTLGKVFEKYNKDIKLIVHAAAQPSHDWAAKEPVTDFSINADGTFNLLEMTRLHCPEAVFIFTSTNKVYGDRPNQLPLVEQDTRWELPEDHPFFKGITEEMSVDQCLHSLFGASKLAADVAAQEYGRYFGMKTGIFRGGCLTGPRHAGAELHGFLSYLMKCAMTGTTYTVYGYKGKQVRDNIHADDLVTAFDHFYRDPYPGEVYNIGGGRANTCSILEAAKMCEEISGKPLKTALRDEPRRGDHIWYVSGLAKFRKHYPEWKMSKGIRETLQEIHDQNRAHW